MLQPMVPFMLIGRNEYIAVPEAYMKFLYPMICAVKPLCEEGPPSFLKPDVDFITAVKSIECNCQQSDCKVNRARDLTYNFLSHNIGTTLLLLQAEEDMVDEVIYQVVDAINGDPANGVPAMRLPDAVHIYQQANLLYHQNKSNKSAGESPVPTTKRKRTSRKGSK